MPQAAAPAALVRLKTAVDRLHLAVQRQGSEPLPQTWLRWHRARATLEGVRPPPAPSAFAPDATPAIAYVNHGHWVADCPAQSCLRCAGPCGSAMDLLPDTSVGYHCGCCWNVELQGRWRPIAWPATSQLARIEAVLQARPLDRNRNWRPDDTVAQLRAENVAHGDPLAAKGGG